MTLEITLSFLTFVFLSGITPGPANLTSLSTALQYGRKAAVHQWFGLISGAMTDCMISVVIVYFLGTALNQYVKWLAFAGTAYLLYLAIHLLRATYTSDPKKIKEPGFFRGYFLQLTNVKIILTCVTSLSSYVLPNTQNFFTIWLFGLMLGLIQPSCNLVWLFTGVSLQRLFVKHQKIINVIMALALAACALRLAFVPFAK